MVKNEEYIDYLKKVISCVNNGDYYSIKELSILKLDTLKEETEVMKKNLSKYVGSNICKKESKTIEKKEVIYIVNLYIEYILNEIRKNKEVGEIASIEEFIQKMK